MRDRLVGASATVVHAAGFVLSDRIQKAECIKDQDA
jgi:hypothetical protein